MSHICKDNDFKEIHDKHIEKLKNIPYDYNDPETIVWYSKNVLKCRWIEKESLILNDIDLAIEYAEHFKFYWNDLVNNVLNIEYDNWMDFNPLIQYLNSIKHHTKLDRNITLEDLIITNDWHVLGYSYCKLFNYDEVIEKLAPLYEPSAKKISKFCIEIIKKPVLKYEDTIKKSPKGLMAYVKEFYKPSELSKEWCDILYNYKETSGEFRNWSKKNKK